MTRWHRGSVIISTLINTCWWFARRMQVFKPHYTGLIILHGLWYCFIMLSGHRLWLSANLAEKADVSVRTDKFTSSTLNCDLTAHILHWKARLVWINHYLAVHSSLRVYIGNIIPSAILLISERAGLRSLIAQTKSGRKTLERELAYLRCKSLEMSKYSMCFMYSHIYIHAYIHAYKY